MQPLNIIEPQSEGFTCHSGAGEQKRNPPSWLRDFYGSAAQRLHSKLNAEESTWCIHTQKWRRVKPLAQ